MDCFHDVCLACERFSPDGPYCSPACKLMDLEKASLPSSPTRQEAPPTSSKQRTSWTSSGHVSSSGYVLAPAYKFPDRMAGYSQPKANDDKRPKSSYFTRSPVDESRQPITEQQRCLTPSSSRSSLSSNASATKSNHISEQAKLELQEYFNSFEHAKASKRRQSTW